MSIIRWQRPALSTWPRFGQLADLQEEIDRFFEAPLAVWKSGSRGLHGWAPALDLREDKDSFILSAELPGMKKEEINLSLQDGNLRISGERKSEKKFENAEVYRAERYVGHFERTMVLPAPVASDKVKAQYKDGVLTVTLPKTEEARPKQIDVQVN
jgi:HSP20 family protein